MSQEEPRPKPPQDPPRAPAHVQESAGPAALHSAAPTALWLRWWSWLAGALRDFGNLVMPIECAACGRADAQLCRDCRKILRAQTAAPFHAEGGADALTDVAGGSSWPVIAAGRYRDVLATAILAFKNHGRFTLAAHLARCLGTAVDIALAEHAGEEILWLVPVPSTGRGWRRRGYDPVATLVRILERERRLPPAVRVAPVLGMRMQAPWRRSAQKSLGKAARRRNVRNTMRFTGKHPDDFWLSANHAAPAVMLLDDVLTTGSTLAEAAKTLEKSGIRVVSAVVLAAAGNGSGTGVDAPETHATGNYFAAKDE